MFRWLTRAVCFALSSLLFYFETSSFLNSVRLWLLSDRIYFTEAELIFKKNHTQVEFFFFIWSFANRLVFLFFPLFCLGFFLPPLAFVKSFFCQILYLVVCGVSYPLCYFSWLIPSDFFFLFFQVFFSGSFLPSSMAVKSFFCLLLLHIICGISHPLCYFFWLVPFDFFW